MFMTGLAKKQELYVAELQRGLTLPRFGFGCAELTAWGKTWHRSDAEDPHGAIIMPQYQENCAVQVLFRAMRSFLAGVQPLSNDTDLVPNNVG